MIALVVGNGESRLGLDLKEFSKDYILVGCNALHRETTVEHLVCCDRRMVEEAIVSDNASKSKIYVRPDWINYFRNIKDDERIHQVPELPYKGNTKADDPIHWGSGPYAVLVAAQLEHVQTILLLGFDLYSNNEKVNNIYKGTKNYNDENSHPVDPSYWIYQISKVFQNYPDKSFIIFNDKKWQMPKEWQQKNVTFEELAIKNLTFA
jgi:hypothetical protein